MAIIGAGRVGLVLGRILKENGAEISCVISRTPRSVAAGKRFLGCRVGSTELAAIPRDTTLIYITAPHGAIKAVAAALARESQPKWRRTAVCHASGMLTADALEPLRELGATVFSFHPLQTFPRDFSPREIVPSARGIAYGVDGDPAAVRRARKLARLLDGRVVLVPPALRVYYHAACVVASNHLTALLANLARMGERMGFAGADRLSAFRPIVQATITNVYRTSPARALSGPVARGGVETVREHLNAVRDQSPDLLPYVLRMTAETVRLAHEKGSLPAGTEEAFHEMLHLFAGPDQKGNL